MREVIRRIAVVATALVVSTIFISACGGGDGPISVIKPPPTPIVVSAAVVGMTSMVAGDSTASPRVELTMSNGTKQDAPSSAVVLGSTAPSIVVVTTTMMKAVAPGTAQITASYPGVTVTPLSVVVTPRPVTVVSTAIVGDTVTEAPRKVQLRLVQKYSDNTEKDLVAVWSYPNPDYVYGEVNSTGLVTPYGIGVLHVYASYQNIQYSFQVLIVGTPWSRWNLSAPVKALAKGTIASNGMAWLWARDTIAGGGVVPTKVWHHLNIPHQNVVDALAMIDSAAKSEGSKFEYVFVTDSASARMHFTYVGPTSPAVPAGHCGWSGPSKVENNSIVEGMAIMLPSPAGCVSKEVLAHSALHMMGFMVHSEELQDILSPSPVWKMTATLAKAINWMVTTYSGVIPIEP